MFPELAYPQVQDQSQAKVAKDVFPHARVTELEKELGNAAKRLKGNAGSVATVRRYIHGKHF
jgi:hypothetical protein